MSMQTLKSFFFFPPMTTHQMVHFTLFMYNQQPCCIKMNEATVHLKSKILNIIHMPVLSFIKFCGLVFGDPTRADSRQIWNKTQLLGSVYLNMTKSVTQQSLTGSYFRQICFRAYLSAQSGDYIMLGGKCLWPHGWRKHSVYKHCPTHSSFSPLKQSRYCTCSHASSFESSTNHSRFLCFLLGFLFSHVCNV